MGGKALQKTLYQTTKSWADRDDEVINYDAEITWDIYPEDDAGKGIKLFKVAKKTKFLRCHFSSATDKEVIKGQVWGFQQSSDGMSNYGQSHQREAVSSDKVTGSPVGKATGTDPGCCWAHHPLAGSSRQRRAHPESRSRGSTDCSKAAGQCLGACQQGEEEGIPLEHECQAYG